jgi:heat-inducible transcriptional repressor
MIPELNDRAQSILRQIVDLYMATGEPVGSRTISKKLGLDLSAASIRNVMANLEAEGLLFAPHTSAGRLPTQAGLRFYVDGLMQIGDLNDTERAAIESRCQTAGQSMNQMFEQASTLLSGLSAAAGVVVAPKTDKPLRQIQFVQIEPKRLLVILVSQDNMVENRILETDGPLPPAALTAAANYLNDRLSGRTLAAARDVVTQEIAAHRIQLDAITTDLVERGIALDPGATGPGHIIIRGQSRLLQDVRALEDLERARHLLSTLEEEETMAKLLDAAQGADGIQIYIGTENRMFEHSGWSMVISPYKSAQNQIIGAIGVIGPTRLNYSRIIPIVDYTSQVIGRLLGG